MISCAHLLAFPYPTHPEPCRCAHPLCNGTGGRWPSCPALSAGQRWRSCGQAGRQGACSKRGCLTQKPNAAWKSPKAICASGAEDPMPAAPINPPLKRLWCTARQQRRCRRCTPLRKGAAAAGTDPPGTAVADQLAVQHYLLLLQACRHLAAGVGGVSDMCCARPVVTCCRAGCVNGELTSCDMRQNACYSGEARCSVLRCDVCYDVLTKRAKPARKLKPKATPNTSSTPP